MAYQLVTIQVQDDSGVMRTYKTTFGDPQLVIRSMQEAKRKYPTLRVYAVDSKTGIIMNIL